MILSELIETFRLGIRNLRLHALRSLLTALGIICGVAAVIWMVAIGEGAKRTAEAMYRGLGVRNIIVVSRKPPVGERAGEQIRFIYIYGIRHDDVKRISATIPHIERVVPLRLVYYQAFRKENRIQCDVFATRPELLKVVDVPVLRGRFINDFDLQRRNSICVIGRRVQRALFGYEDPLGQWLLVDKFPFRVVGVIGSTASTGSQARSLGARNFDDEIYIPMTTADACFGRVLLRREKGSFQATAVDVDTLYIRVDEMSNVEPAARMLQRALKYSHEDTEDYRIVVPYDLMQAVRRQQRTWQFVLASIAAISLLVGGIGIMNIMLATVTERTREIGIRRALGARRRHIVHQFLVETVVLSGAGGVLGVLLGVAGQWVSCSAAFKAWLGIDLPMFITPEMPVLSFVVAVLVGVGFGMYPAIKAAHLDPIEALRRE